MTTPRNRTRREDWDAIARLFHWSTAALIIVMMVLGWLAVTAPMSPWKIQLFNWHKSLGLFVLTWVALRLAWRLTHPAPPPPETMSSPERWAARLTHGGLYLLLLAMPLSGWIINSAADFPLKWFGLFRVPQLVAPDKSLQDAAEAVHYAIFWLIAVLVVIHAAAALFHHFVRRDNVLRRMLPFVTIRR